MSKVSKKVDKKVSKKVDKFIDRTGLTPERKLSLEWSVEKGLVKRDGCWWSERRSSMKVREALDFYIFNRSFELEFTRDYYGKPKRHDKLVP
jgi:hypothetical protein